jgi:hypothetical protein
MSKRAASLWRVGQRAAGFVASGHVDEDAAERRPGPGDDAELGVGLAEAGWVKYGCSSTWSTAGTTPVRSSRRGMCFALKFETPIARPPLGEHRLGRLVGADGRLEVGRHRLVQQVEIDLVEAEPAQASRRSRRARRRAVVADPIHSLVVTKISSRSIPERWMASPTSRSLPYAAAVSISR